ncbi:MAG: hypothetical protein HZC15_02765, partial [Candidatus Omnitrophica bacterium]|nr:hypothetical protein [Candidatus Omnitrophota bacterium]
MKISVFSLPDIKLGKYNVKDARLDEVDKITKAKKKTYIQVELVGEDAAIDADAILTAKDSAADLILKDIDFVETRLSRSTDEKEKTLLGRLKVILEKEEFICGKEFNEEEKKLMASYGLLTAKAVVTAQAEELEDLNNLLSKAVAGAEYISFFT